MSCTGPCEQGRKTCPTPEACQRPDHDGGMELLGMLMIYLMGVASGTVFCILFF
jgi:hypothetical protein